MENGTWLPPDKKKELERLIMENEKQLYAQTQPFYIQTVEFKNEIQKVGELEKAVQEMRDIQQAERQARIDAENRSENASRKQIRENRTWQLLTVTIGLLTLAATIVFGILGLQH